jgi:hypothetical protein
LILLSLFTGAVLLIIRNMLNSGGFGIISLPSIVFTPPFPILGSVLFALHVPVFIPWPGVFNKVSWPGLGGCWSCGCRLHLAACQLHISLLPFVVVDVLP